MRRLVLRRYNSTCPYEALGLRPGASEAQVKEAYRTHAKRWHPDAYRGGDRDAAEAQFRRGSDAYAQLSQAGGGASSSGAGKTTRDENGQTVWRRRYARPTSTDPSSAKYWHEQARASRPDAHDESEFRVPPAGEGSSRGRLIVGPLVFAAGMGLMYFAGMGGSTAASPPRGAEAQRRGAEVDSNGLVDAVYNTRRRRWESPHASMYNDPLVVSMISQKPAGSVFKPSR
jgi:hypothetical protein